MTQDTAAVTKSGEKTNIGPDVDRPDPEDLLSEEIRTTLEYTIVLPEACDIETLTTKYSNTIIEAIAKQIQDDGSMLLFNSARRLPVPVHIPI